MVFFILTVFLLSYAHACTCVSIYKYGSLDFYVAIFINVLVILQCISKYIAFQ